MKQIGKIILQRMKEHNITIKNISQQSGIAVATVSNIIYGRSSNPDFLHSILKTIDMNYAEVLFLNPSELIDFNNKNFDVKLFNEIHSFVFEYLITCKISFITSKLIKDITIECYHQVLKKKIEDFRSYIQGIVDILIKTGYLILSDISSDDKIQ